MRTDAEWARLLEAFNREYDRAEKADQRIAELDANYQRIISEVLACDPRPASSRTDDQLEPPWEVIARILRERDRAREALQSMVWQFAHSTDDGKMVYLLSGGLSALEEAFEVLGWSDPMPCPERVCEIEGCGKEATCGTPTIGGKYKRCCGDHFRVLSEAVAAARATGEEQ